MSQPAPRANPSSVWLLAAEQGSANWTTVLGVVKSRQKGVD